MQTLRHITYCNRSAIPNTPRTRRSQTQSHKPARATLAYTCTTQLGLPGATRTCKEQATENGNQQCAVDPCASDRIPIASHCHRAVVRRVAPDVSLVIFETLGRHPDSYLRAHLHKWDLRRYWKEEHADYEVVPAGGSRLPRWARLRFGRQAAWGGYPMPRRYSASCYERDRQISVGALAHCSACCCVVPVSRA